jgi:hypothetical protein
MTPSEIILQDSQRNGVDGQRLLQGIAYAVKNGTAKVIHKNNSVLTMQNMGNESNAYSLHLFTLDEPISLAKALASFIKTIRNMEGVQTVYGDTDNQQLLGLLGKLGVDVLQSDLDGYTWMAKV